MEMTTTPYPMRHVQMSLACGVRNRRIHLERTVPAALAVTGIRHVVIADFGSTDGSLEYLKSLRHERLIVVECIDAQGVPWNAPIAINTAWKMAAELGANIIGCFDADVILKPNYAKETAKVLAPGNAVTKQDATPRGSGLNGTIAVRTDEMRYIGGYDERMQGWGHYDNDVWKRLRDVGGEKRHAKGCLEHIPHDDGARAKNEQEKNITFRPLLPGEQKVFGWEKVKVHTSGGTRKFDGGLLYVVYGDKYKRRAEWSIFTARLWNPGIEIAVIGDDIAETLHIPPTGNPGHGARHWKTSIGELSPFEKTVFLDADTVVCSQLDSLFDALTYYDFLAVCDFVPCPIDDSHLPSDDKEALFAETCLALPQYNSGVIGFTRNAKPTLALWNKEWHRIKTKPTPDQGALMRAVWKTKPRMLTLGRTWNGPRDGSRIWHRNYEKHPNMQGRNGPIANIRDMEERRMLRGWYLRG